MQPQIEQVEQDASYVIIGFLATAISGFLMGFILGVLI